MQDHEKEQELLAILMVCTPALAEADDYTVESVASLAKAREWGVGLENLCDQLYEYEIPLSRALHARMVRLGQAMEMNPSTWDMLEELVSEEAS